MFHNISIYTRTSPSSRLGGLGPIGGLGPGWSRTSDTPSVDAIWSPKIAYIDAVKSAFAAIERAFRRFRHPAPAVRKCMPHHQISDLSTSSTVKRHFRNRTECRRVFLRRLVAITRFFACANSSILIFLFMFSRFIRLNVKFSFFYPSRNISSGYGRHLGLMSSFVTADANPVSEPENHAGILLFLSSYEARTTSGLLQQRYLLL